MRKIKYKFNKKVIVPGMRVKVKQNWRVLKKLEIFPYQYRDFIKNEVFIVAKESKEFPELGVCYDVNYENNKEAEGWIIAKELLVRV